MFVNHRLTEECIGYMSGKRREKFIVITLLCTQFVATFSKYLRMKIKTLLFVNIMCLPKA